jgi:hypothetical protein
MEMNITGLRWLDRWLDLFNSFPSLAGRVPVEVFLQLVPLVHSRYYSIASSSCACPGEVRPMPRNTNLATITVLGRLRMWLANGLHRKRAAELAAGCAAPHPAVSR